MDDEIDLREYLRPLVAHWMLILGLGVLAAVVAAVINLSVPPTYQAESLVSVAPASYSLRLAGAATALPVPLKAYPDFALSSDVLNAVFVQFGGKLPRGVDTLSKFQRIVAAVPASDPTLLRLTVRDGNPAQAAEIANAWAAVFTARAGELFAQDQANVRDYDQQLGQSKIAMKAADDALAAFQAGNQVNILKAQLASQQAVLVDYLNRDHQMALLMGDTQDLLGRLAKLSPGAPSNLAEDLALLSIMTRVYGGQMVDTGQPAPNQPGLQIQVGTGKPLVGPTVADQQALAADLLSTLKARHDSIQSQVQAIEPNILALQGQQAQAQVMEDQLTRARDLAASQYLALAPKVEEAKIALGESANVVQVASRADVPTEAIGTHTLTIAVVAGAVGLLMGAAIVLFVDYWRKGTPRSNPALPSTAGAND
jgi:uncharacterized protein involved in exopolysaccharide biosynthesis